MPDPALQSNIRFDGAAGAVLRSIFGGSKSAKLAKLLLQVKHDRDKQMPVRVRAAIAAVARAERWQVIRTTETGNQ